MRMLVGPARAWAGVVPPEPGTSLSWSGVPSPIAIAIGGSHNLAQYVEYDGEGSVTYSSIGASLAGTGISLNTSTGVLSVSGGASAGTVSGIQIRATDGTLSADSEVFSVTKETSALALDVPHTTAERLDIIDLTAFVTYAGVGTLTFTEVGSKLPPYLPLHPSGKLYIAANSPPYALTGVQVMVSDGTLSDTATFDLTVDVTEELLAWHTFLPTMVRTPSSVLDLSEQIDYAGAGVLEYSTIGAGLPSGVSLNPSTGRLTISGAPTGVTSGLRFRVSDGTVARDSMIFALSIVDEVLLLKEDVEHGGAFRVPGASNSGFAWGGCIGIHPAGNGGAGSLYATGNETVDFTGEISIPATVKSSSLGSLNTATLLQDMHDATEGHLLEVQPTDGVILQSYMVHDSKLLISAWGYYSFTQKKSHFVRPLDLSSTGELVGPKECTVLNSHPWHPSSPDWVKRSIGGYMCKIPAEFQAALGGDMLTGIGGMPTNSYSSCGPAAYVANLDDMISEASPEVYCVLAYPLAARLNLRFGVESMENGNRWWNNTSQVRGVAFVPNTDCVLFFGEGGEGVYWYGQAEPMPDPNNPYPWGYDPYSTNQGGHIGGKSWVKVWAYRVSDLIDVRAGNRLPYEVDPYAVWNLEVPMYSRQAAYEQGAGVGLLSGTFDEANNRILISVARCDGDSCVIHALNFNSGA